MTDYELIMLPMVGVGIGVCFCYGIYFWYLKLPRYLVAILLGSGVVQLAFVAYTLVR